MHRILLVARQEFLTNIRRRSFLFVAFGLPLIIVAVQFAVGYFVSQQSTTTGTLGAIGYVDLSPRQLLRDALEKPQEFRAYPDAASAKTALVAGEIGAYFVVPAEYLSRGVVEAYAIKDIPRGIEGQMATFLTNNLLADWPPDRSERLRKPMNLSISTLDGEDEIRFDDSAVVVILLPFIFGLLLMMAIFTTSGFLLQAVVEEKENRLIEILVTSITPLQMLWGKIIGLGALGMLQVVIWATTGGLVLARGSSLWSGLENVRIPAELLIWTPAYLILGYLLYSALMAGLGASVTSVQEGQQLSSILGLLAASPMIAVGAFFSNANGPIPTLLSLVPLTSPVAMVMRLPYADVPLWQIIVSLLLLVGMTVLIVWIAGQLFRVGLLMYSKRLDPRSLWRVLRQGLDAVPESHKEPAP